MHNRVRQWIADVISNNPRVIDVAIEQRAKFEGWLKFALASEAIQAGSPSVMLEAPISSKSNSVSAKHLHGH